MNINSYTQQKLSFSGGLTQGIKREIHSVNPYKVEQIMANNNINADFENNKIIAWCCAKALEIIKKLNLRLGLPANIFVKDLNTLNCQDLSIYAFTNFLPCRITKNSDEITPAVSIIFNKDFNWEYLDEASDYEFYDAHNTATDFFLEPFLHEFGHIAHERHLIDKFGTVRTVQSLVNLTEETTVDKYQTRFSIKEKDLCGCAKASPLELIACDLSKRIINCIDRNRMALDKNSFISSPYQRFFDIVSLFRKYSLQDLLINNFYNGKTDVLDRI